MSQDNSKQSIDNNSQIPIERNYINNIINNLDLDIDEKENIILNNIISNTSTQNNILNKNYTDNNLQKNSLSSINSNDVNKKEKNINSIFLLLYKELISFIEETNINYNYFANEYNKIKNILTDQSNNSIYESIINIFKKSIKKVINEKTKEIKDSLDQCKSTILLLEKNNRYFIQQNFLKQTKIDILENEIDSYMEMEEEFDEMKEKLKYENGKFLHNEKKENEILILRAENSNLKKVIDKNEKTIEEKEHIIETIKKKSSSMLNTNNNTIKNSLEINEEHNHPSSLIFGQNSQKSKFNYNHTNITNFKSYNIIQKMKSPINNNYQTNNNSQSSKKINFGETNNCSKNKKNNLTSRASTKELLNRKIKNKVLNMKKIRRINDSYLDNYNNKSSAHITNSIMSNNSNNSSSKRLKKNINSFFKSNKNNIFNGINKIHKKLSSGITNGNISNIVKNNSNKIIVNSILDNNNNQSNNNNSFFFKTTRKKFGISKKSSKKNVKKPKEEYLLIRNNNSLMKSPNTFNNPDFENNVGMKNNIIINNIIQNSTSVPISAATSKSKEKINCYENELNQNNKNDINNSKYLKMYIRKDKNIKTKSSGHLSVNIKKKNN